MSTMIHSRAQERGIQLGLDDAAIADMVRRGAAYTHPRGNTRFDAYWFTVLDGEVLEMGLINPLMVTNWVMFPDAAGCTYCDGTMRTIMVDKDNSERLVACPRMQNRDLPLCNGR